MNLALQSSSDSTFAHQLVCSKWDGFLPHDGTVTAYSEGLGKGASFEVK
jgi:hypothetical protein